MAMTANPFSPFVHDLLTRGAVVESLDDPIVVVFPASMTSAQIAQSVMDVLWLCQMNIDGYSIKPVENGGVRFSVHPD